MKKKSVLASAIVCAVMVVSPMTVFTGCNKNPEEEIITIPGDNLSVGIISDTQLTENYDSYAVNLEKALTYLRDRNTDVLVFAGDYSDLGTQGAADMFKSVYDKVYPDNKPVSVAVMGNHDYWLANFFDCWEIPVKSKMRGRLEGIFGDDYTNVKVINGYTFIALSPMDGSMTGKYDIDYARKALDAATARDKDKPVFVVTHHTPSDTILGGEEWGNEELNELFSDYPNVVSISGHLHYSMLDEKNVMQKNYTAIGTQSLSYTDFEGGYEPVSVTADIQSTPMLLYMTVSGNSVTTERIFVNDGSEYDPDNRYVFTFPYDKENALYGEDRKERKAPVFSNFSGGIAEKDGVRRIRVTAAECAALVTEYRMRFIGEDGKAVIFSRNDGNRDTLKYLSDFFTGHNEPVIDFAIPQDLPAGTYTVELSALESFGNESVKVNFVITV